MKATLIYRQKARIHGCFILDMAIHRVYKSDKYPDGIKYGLILIDEITQKRVLMDNHHPKGSHIHLDNQEIEYEFVDEMKLIQDFKDLVLMHMGVML
jgi:hypothetical protein